MPGGILSIEGGREALLWSVAAPAVGDATLRSDCPCLAKGFQSGRHRAHGRILEDERAFGDIDFGWGAWVNRPAAGHFDFHLPTK